MAHKGAILPWAEGSVHSPVACEGLQEAFLDEQALAQVRLEHSRLNHVFPPMDLGQFRQGRHERILGDGCLTCAGPSSGAVTALRGTQVLSVLERKQPEVRL